MKAVVLVLLALVCLQQASGLIVDGFRDPCYIYSGTIQYRAGQPINNLNSPVNYTSGPTYDLYQYADQNYIYGFLETVGPASPVNASIYYNLNPAATSPEHFDLGVLLNNSRMAIFANGKQQSNPTNYPQTISRTDANHTALEFAAPRSYFSSSSFVADDNTTVSHTPITGNTVTVAQIAGFSATVVDGAFLNGNKMVSLNGSRTNQSPTPSPSACYAENFAVLNSAGNSVFEIDYSGNIYGCGSHVNLCQAITTGRTQTARASYSFNSAEVAGNSTGSEETTQHFEEKIANLEQQLNELKARFDQFESILKN